MADFGQDIYWTPQVIRTYNTWAYKPFLQGKNFKRGRGVQWQFSSKEGGGGHLLVFKINEIFSKRGGGGRGGPDTLDRIFVDYGRQFKQNYKQTNYFVRLEGILN